MKMAWVMCIIAGVALMAAYSPFLDYGIAYTIHHIGNDESGMSKRAIKYLKKLNSDKSIADEPNIVKLLTGVVCCMCGVMCICAGGCLVFLGVIQLL